SVRIESNAIALNLNVAGILLFNSDCGLEEIALKDFTLPFEVASSETAIKVLVTWLHITR
ncbi:hypothetical protein AAUPMG_04342, partial [Pasteurella multocida subsp. multocida str. Anand1_goat]